MKRPVPPCRGCERRTPEDPEKNLEDCHKSCEAYEEYVKANEAYKAGNRRIEIRDYIRDRISNDRRKNWHK